MLGRTPHEAIQAYLELVQRALSYLTPQVVRASGADPSVDRLSLLLSGGRPVPLLSRINAEAKLSLRVMEEYEFRRRSDLPARQGWQVRVAKYLYAVERTDTEAEVVAFHWHPDTPTPPYPHLHIGPAATPPAFLSRAHIPTGMVYLPMILRFIITDLSVRPLRPDWHQGLLLVEADIRAGADT